MAQLESIQLPHQQYTQKKKCDNKSPSFLHALLRVNLALKMNSTRPLALKRIVMCPIFFGK